MYDMVNGTEITYPTKTFKLEDGELCYVSVLLAPSGCHALRVGH